MFYDARINNHGFPNDPFKALIAPRPVGWISTLSTTGKANLAPYSFFNAFSERPHYVAYGTSGGKDTIANSEAKGEFAVNLVNFAVRDQMNVTSTNAGKDVDEFELAGLAKAECRMIKPPRVAASPACLECALYKTVELPSDDGTVSNFMVIGRVIGIHIDDQFIHEGRVNSAAMQLIARLGYSEYSTITETWRMWRPT